MWSPYYHRSVYHPFGVSSTRLPTCTTPVSDRGGTFPCQAVCPCGPHQPERRGKASQKGTVSAEGPQGEGLHSSEGLGGPGCGRCFQDGCSSAETSHWPEGKHAGEEEWIVSKDQWHGIFLTGIKFDNWLCVVNTHNPAFITIWLQTNAQLMFNTVWTIHNHNYKTMSGLMDWLVGQHNIDNLLYLSHSLSKNAKHILVADSEMWQFTSFLCFKLV